MTLPLGQLFSISKMTFQPPWLLKKNFFLGLTWLAFQDSLELFPRESNQKPFSEFPDLSYKPPVSNPRVPCAHLSEHPAHRMLFHRIGPHVRGSLSLSTTLWTLRVLVSLLFFDLFISVCLVAQACPTLGDPMDCSPPGSSVHGNSPGKKTGVGCHPLLQGIFPTQGMNPGLPHCRRFLYCLRQLPGTR